MVKYIASFTKKTIRIIVLCSLLLIVVIGTSCGVNSTLDRESENNVISVKINYVLPDYIYFNKDALFYDFFTSLYRYVKKCDDGPHILDKYNVKNEEDALNLCKTWLPHEETGLTLVGLVYANFFFKNRYDASFMDYIDDYSFLGECLRNKRFIDFLYYCKTFFYYWRVDEGAATAYAYAANFFANNYASIIDIAKLFYFTKDDLPKYFYNNNRVPMLYDCIPGVLNSPFPIVENIKLSKSDEHILPSLDCYGFKIDGYYYNKDFSGEKIIKIEYGDLLKLDTNTLENGLTLYPHLIRTGMFAEEINRDFPLD